MFFRVYGVISQILEPGAFALCTPILVKSYERGKPTKFYQVDSNGQVVEIDLKQYGAPVFLPAGKKKINDGNEYFIIYRTTQNFTHVYCKDYANNNIIICTDERIWWMTANISMGIKFPNKFVCVLKPNLDKESLEKMMQTES